jgi:hypothetical protein
METIDLKTIYTILHLFGVAIGAGGAFMSDAMYLSSVKDKRLLPTEARFLRLGGFMVWSGLFLLVISGILLFSTNPAYYLASDKFLLKMITVGIITVNGLVFHLIHLPVLHRTTDKEAMHTDDEFKKKSLMIYVSGGISAVSWSAAIILGALRSLPVSLPLGLLTYVLLILGAVAFALFHRFLFFSK